MHIDGVDNKVADCLSRYYENNMSDNTHSDNAYVNADICFDPDGKLLPTDHYMDLKVLTCCHKIVLKSTSMGLQQDT